MAISIRPYGASDVPAALAFNERMRQGKAASEFLLPDSPPPPTPEGAKIRSVFYLAVDNDFVRGGFVLCDYPAFVAQQPVTATDLIAPLSEGIVDPAFGMVGMQHIKYLQKYTKHGMAVGMGDVNNPFPRLLKAAGWTVLKVPFFFHVVRAGRFLREMRVFDATPARKIAAKIAGPTGLGAIGVAALQARKWMAGGGLTVEPVQSWESWATDLWRAFLPNCAFAVSRDADTLPDLHPSSDQRLQRLLIKRNGRPVAWAAALLTQMRDDKYFGNLKVATILDCVSSFDDMPAAIVAATTELGRRGADLVITNQTHVRCQQAFRAAGYLPGPSNYCLGLSKTIGDAVRSSLGESGLGEDAIYVTRADGDGRMHL